MRVVVTGGAGYVGAVAVPTLLAAGHQVRVLDSLRTGGQGLLAACHDPRLEIDVGDVRDAIAVGRAIADADAIIHLAAIVGYPSCQREPELARAINVEGTRTLLRARRPEQRLLFASTGSVYGAVRDGVCSEASPRRPVTLYAETKTLAETIVMESGNAVSFRFATAFGTSPSMRFDLLVNDFTRQAVQTGVLKLYESHFRRTFIHVRDMARSLVFALARWEDLVDEAYNVGVESLNLTKRAVADRIALHMPLMVELVEAGTDADRRDYEVSYAKLRSKGFTALFGIDEGIAELVRAVRLLRVA